MIDCVYLAIHKREGELFNNNNFGIRCLFFHVVGS